MPRSWICVSTVFWMFVAFAASSVLARSESWSGFYSMKRPLATGDITDAHCLAAILSAQEQFGIPNNLLLAIGIQEAGRNSDDGITVWPWAVNADGKGIFFRSREQAIGWVQTQLAQGRQSIDVGCMQINLHWHANAFESLEEAFDPVANADYAARFLSNLRRSEGSWWQAAGSYHSKTPDVRARYLSRLKQNQTVAINQFDRFSRRVKNAGLAYVTKDDPAGQPPVLWGQGAKISSGFSIYSHRPLAPVLPEFEEVF